MGHPGFHKVLDEMRAVHDRKSADYGFGDDPLANCRASEEFGVPAWVGVLIRLNDKVTRLKSYLANGKLANEGVEDALLDLTNYGAIALVLYRELVAADPMEKASEPKCSHLPPEWDYRP
jgi:hypothetical protein